MSRNPPIPNALLSRVLRVLATSHGTTNHPTAGRVSCKIETSSIIEVDEASFRSGHAEVCVCVQREQRTSYHGRHDLDTNEVLVNGENWVGVTLGTAQADIVLTPHEQKAVRAFLRRHYDDPDLRWMIERTTTPSPHRERFCYGEHTTDDPREAERSKIGDQVKIACADRDARARRSYLDCGYGRDRESRHFRHLRRRSHETDIRNGREVVRFYGRMGHRHDPRHTGRPSDA